MLKSLTALGLTLALLPVQALAQSTAETWPSRPVRIIAPFPPGGTIDQLSRIWPPCCRSRWASLSWLKTGLAQAAHWAPGSRPRLLPMGIPSSWCSIPMP